MTKPQLQLVKGLPSTLVRSSDDGNRTSAASSDTSVDVAHDDFIEYLFERYRPALSRYLRRFMQTDEDIDEVLQETYLRVVQTDNLDQLEVKARGYLFKIATNLVRDKFRYDRVRSRSDHVSADEVELVSAEPGPEKLAEWNEQLAFVQQCLLELPVRTRRIFLLRTLEQMTYREIAGTLEISTRTVERELVTAFDLCTTRLKAPYHV